jgi:hypothetical protein
MSDPLDLSGGKDNSPEKSRVTKLQEKLYSPNTQFQIRSRQNLKRQIGEVPEGWQDVDKNSFSQVVDKKKVSVFSKIVIFAFVFFIAAVGFAFYKFTGIGPSQYSSTVDLTVIGPVAIGGGEEMSLDFIIQNKNPFPLETVDIVIEYPEGTKTSDLQNDLPRFREGLGDIPANSIVKKTYSATLFGEEGEQKNIDARIEYRVPNSNAIFETKKNFELVLQSSPVRLVVDTVKEITSGQALNFDVTVASNSNSELQNVLVTVDYPFGFSFSESTIPPTKGNNTWFFEKLSPQESKTFTLRGSLVGQNNEERVFKWNVGLSDVEKQDEFKVQFTTIPKSISLTKPFLALDLAIDGDLGVDVVRVGTAQIDGRLTFKNNTGSVIADPQIVLKLDGEVLEDAFVDLEGGFFNSADNTITWNKVTNPEIFKEIDVAETATLAFTFRSKSLASRQAVFKNPEIVASATITGKRVGEENVPEDIKVDIAKRIKFQSDINLSAQTSHVSGPFPPKVEQDTVYRIKLDVTNSSNLINRGKVRATLPPYVKWNNTFTPSSEKVVYMPSSRTIEWELGDIREHAGFIDPARTLSVDVTLTPSATQIGQSPQLLIDPTFIGFDSFTQTEITETAVAPTIDMGRLSDLETSKVVE